MRFSGWPASAAEFYDGLQADNSKSYWTAHRATYDSCVLRPMEELLAELAPEFGEGKIFRPYRDVRFSADKSPYKTTIAATLARGGYVQFSADGLGAACGMYNLAGEQLERYRRAVDQDRSGEELAAIVAALRRAGVIVTSHGTLKSSPRGYSKDHPRIDLLRHKGLVAWQEWPPEDSARGPALVTAFLHSSAPLQEWLTSYVG